MDGTGLTMEGKRVLVTGGNRGIGEQTVWALARKGAHVWLHGRSEEKIRRAQASIEQEDLPGQVRTIRFDLASQQQVREGAASIRDEEERLDVLVNNAGAVLDSRRFTEEGIEMQFAVNHLAPFLLTHELLPLLRDGDHPRVVNVASEAHRSAGSLPAGFQDTEGRYSGFRVYAQTKLYNLLFTFHLAGRLGERFCVNALHPGVVASGFGREGPWYVRWFMKLARPFLRDPEQAAATVVHLASSPQLETTGGYFIDEAPRDPSPRARDQRLQERLWSTSEELTGATEWPPP